ncbi:hypothetical protein IU450_36260 [Nocardia abscessus]|uniref:hypothetical protein n=1 Tax=Nocardia abscessus TaxID=120957 RepID=UPI001894CFB3|nr:hypothetical protein [Nocardia abscessus]MBF6341297.1 hypothetical protein [Nocardia abscessus]
MDSAHVTYKIADAHNQRLREAGRSGIQPLDGDWIRSDSGMWQVVGVGVNGLLAVRRATDPRLVPELMLFSDPLDPLRWHPNVSADSVRAEVTMTDEFEHARALFRHSDGRLLTCGFPVRVWQATSFEIDESQSPVTHPRTLCGGQTNWACCSSMIGPPCGHRHNPDGSVAPLAAADSEDGLDAQLRGVRSQFPGTGLDRPSDAEWERAELIIGDALQRYWPPGTRLVWPAPTWRNRACLRSQVRRHLLRIFYQGCTPASPHEIPAAR